MSPGPAPSLSISVAVIVSVIARSVIIGLPHERPKEVARRDDPDRGGRGVYNDEAVDSALLHRPGCLFEAGRAVDGERRLGHHLADREAGPVGNEMLIGANPYEVGLAEDANQKPIRVDDGKTGDLLRVEDRGGFREGSRLGDRDRVGSHRLRNALGMGHRATSAAAGAPDLPVIDEVTSITPSYAP